MILIFVSFYINGVDHLFICILAIYISSWRNVYSSPLSTLTRSLLFLLLSCRSSLYVLDVCVCMHVLSCVWLFVPHEPTRLLCPWDSWERILEWVAIYYSRESSKSRDWTWIPCVSCIGRGILYHKSVSKGLSIFCCCCCMCFCYHS